MRASCIVLLVFASLALAYLSRSTGESIFLVASLWLSFIVICIQCLAIQLRPEKGDDVVLKEKSARFRFIQLTRRFGAESFLLVFVLIFLALLVSTFRARVFLLESVESEISLPYAGAFVAFGIICLFVEVLIKSLSDETNTQGSFYKRVSLKCIEANVSLLAVVMIIVGSALLAEHYTGIFVRHYVGLILTIFVLLFSLEVVGRSLHLLYTPTRYRHQLLPVGFFTIFKFRGAEYREFTQTVVKDSDLMDLRLSEMWMLGIIRRSLLPLLVVVLILSWGATCFHTVDSNQKGLRERLGKISSVPLEPGLHTSLPYPFGRVLAVDTARMREVVVGFEADTGEPILWDRAHYKGEKMALVGSGDDFLAISIPVIYRVSDPYLFVRNVTDIEKLIENLTYKATLHECTSRSSYSIMASDRELIRKNLQHELQDQLDSWEAGIEIVEICLRDIHPPVQVAKSYQEVFSAKEDKKSQIFSAEAIARASIPNARANAAQIEASSNQRYEKKVSLAEGRANRYSVVAGVHRDNPSLFESRQYYHAIDETLSGAKKLIIDHHFNADLPAYIDLRNVLNPDYIDAALPTKQYLVPDIKDYRDKFEIQIGGFLFRDDLGKQKDSK